MTEHTPDGQLTEEQVKELSNLDAETFSLDAFLDQDWKFPAFSTTVYLDGERAGQIHELDEAIKRVTKQRSDKLNRAKQNGTTSLAGITGNSMVDTYEEDAELERLEAERAKLHEKYKTSSLKIVFRLPEPADEVHKKALALTQVKFPDVKKERDLEKNDEAMDLKGNYLLLQIIEGIYNHAGARYGGELTVDTVKKLYAKLIPSERVRIQTNLGLAMSGGQVMQRAADAGFPG
jgi:hypothetical protein